MIDVLIAVIIFCIFAGLIYWLVLQLPIPEPFATIIRVAVILIAILIVLGVMTGKVNLPMFFRLRA